MEKKSGKIEYRPEYGEKYRLDEPIPHVGILADEYNDDGWEKVRRGYVEIFEENGEKFARVTEKGRAAIARVKVDIEKGDHHKPTQGSPENIDTSLKRLIHTAVENIYGDKYLADLVEKTPNQYILFVRPRVEAKEKRDKYKLKLKGTLEEISNQLDDEMMGEAKSKVAGL